MTGTAELPGHGPPGAAGARLSTVSWDLGSGLLGSPVLGSWGSCCGWEVEPHRHSIQPEMHLEVIFKVLYF